MSSEPTFESTCISERLYTAPTLSIKRHHKFLITASVWGKLNFFAKRIQTQHKQTSNTKSNSLYYPFASNKTNKTTVKANVTTNLR